MKKIPLTPKHLEILEKRGLDPELLVNLGVTSLDRADGDWIAIPYTADGIAVNHKYRTISGDKRFSQDADARKCFWNLDCLKDETLHETFLIVTEGEFDAMIAMQCGYQRVVSVPDGAPAVEIGDKEGSAKYSYLEDAQHLFTQVKEIILCTDGDKPGVNLMNDLALRLGKAKCKWVKYPKGCKDLNETFLKYGQRGVQETINRAQWCKVHGIYRMSELPPLNEQPAVDIGITGLSQYYKVRLGDFCIVTGIPSHGKTSFINDVACHMVRNHGWNVVFGSFEQKPQIDHKRALRTWFNAKPSKHQTPEERQKADAWIDQHFSFIVPSEDDEADLAWVLERAAAAALRFNAKLVVLDPWNEMDHIRPRDMTLTEYTGFAIKQFKKMAAKYQVHLIVAAHPAKQQKDKATGLYQIPSLYDISDSAHWYNKADIGLIVHRDDKGTVLRNAKSRYHDQIGKPGDWECSFDPYSNRFHSAAGKSESNVRSMYGD